MNYKDLYEDETEFSDANDGLDEIELTEMELYICSTEDMEERVLAITRMDITPEDQMEQINELRRTGYLANSTYYEEIFQMSLKRTKLPAFVKENHVIIEENKNFFKRNGLTLVKGKESYVVKLKNKVLIECPCFVPDKILNIHGINQDNQADYHFLAGYLLSAEIFETIQLGLTILATSNKIEALFK